MCVCMSVCRSVYLVLQVCADVLAVGGIQQQLEDSTEVVTLPGCGSVCVLNVCTHACVYVRACVRMCVSSLLTVEHHELVHLFRRGPALVVRGVIRGLDLITVCVCVFVCVCVCVCRHAPL